MKRTNKLKIIEDIKNTAINACIDDIMFLYAEYKHIMRPIDIMSIYVQEIEKECFKIITELMESDEEQE